MTEATKRKVLITGAGGKIGSDLALSLGDRYDLRLHYRTLPSTLVLEDSVAADIRQLDQMHSIMQGVDTVLHLAGDPSVPASWESVYTNNIGGMYNVMEAAREAGVRRVVFASTNHVMGMHDVKADWPVYNSMPQRPDSYYGVSKAFGEDLGRYYWDQWGLEFIALRIGWYLHDLRAASGEVGLAMWLSQRDCDHAFTCAIETAEQYGVFYAISDNPNRRWDITDAQLKIGYRPQDSWVRALEVPEGVEPGSRAPGERWGTEKWDE
ncbi:MAG: NAD(P)-dependent oxidoreductase [Thermomicrobiales bacterium]